MKRLVVPALLVLLGACTAPAQEALEKGFKSPPPECRPDCFYQVMGGTITKEGLTKDFEAIAKQGLGGVMLMQMPDQLAGVVSWAFRDHPGKFKVLSDEWFALWNFALGELDRLGLTFSTVPCPGWSHVGGPHVTPDKSGKILVGGYKKLQGPARFEGVISRPPLHYEERKPSLPPFAPPAEVATWKKLKESYGDFYRDVAVVAFPSDAGEPPPRMQRKGDDPVLGGKEKIAKLAAIPPEKIINLTGKMDDQGRLTWDVPEGTWTVVRLGLESYKEPNYPAPVEGAGLECDRMDPQAIHLVFDHYVGRLLREALAKGYKCFKGFDTDSYESVSQDFCADFPEQFKKRMGYDCTPWLPVWLDKRLVIGSSDLTTRFRRDMQQVVSELWMERFYGEIKRFAEANKLQWMIEPYFKLTIDWRTISSRAHLPGCEFWIQGEAKPDDVIRDLIGPAPDSAALYNQPIVWAEAFTSRAESNSWRNDPWLLKPFGDAAFCRGINHFVMHGFVHNPFDNIRPGFSFGYWGSQFSRHLTWWPYSLPWHQYLARCQFMLRQGLPVADVLAYPPKTEHIASPVLECAPYKQVVSNDETLLSRVSVKDGRLVLPHGVSYAALAIPPKKPGAFRNVTPQALSRIRDLVKDGATLIGDPVPAHSASMENYPQCDQQLAALIAEIWGEGKIAKQGERQLGKGRVIWGRPLTQSLDQVTSGPDFEFVGIPQFAPGKLNPSYDFVHRHTSEADVYFVANLKDQPLEVSAKFRVTGRRPQLWDAVTGQIRQLPEVKDAGGFTVIPMKFDPRQSFFVVFAAAGQANAQESKKNFPAARPVGEIEGSWQVAFDPKWGGPAEIEFPKLEDWTKRPEEGIKYYSGTATYKKTFAAPAAAVKAAGPVYLDLGKVKNLAKVRLNGKDLGIVWCAPWRVNVAGVLKEKDNQLEIEVVNLWVNRIIGDEQLPPDAEYVHVESQCRGGYREDVDGYGLKDLPDWLIKGEPRPTKRFTFYNWKFYPKDAPLLESGLMGPVRLTAQE